jgi:hypothetical protein
MVSVYIYTVKSLYSRKMFIIHFNAIFTCKSYHIYRYVLLASHLKVHATIEKRLTDEQSVSADFFCSWRSLFCSWQCLFSPVAWACQ